MQELTQKDVEAKDRCIRRTDNGLNISEWTAYQPMDWKSANGLDIS